MTFEIIHLENFDFIWGTSLLNIKSKINQNLLLKSFPERSSLKFRYNNFLNFKTLSCHLSAPFPDRPIISISFELETPFQQYQPDSKYWSNNLVNFLGKPTNESTQHNYGSGSVIYNCNWEFENQRVGLSVYGGIRKEEEGSSAAMLYISWTDIKTASDKYLKLNEDIEFQISENIKSIYKKHIFTLSEKQYFFKSLHYTNKENEYTNKDFLRKAFRALFANGLFETPDEIKSNLSDFQVCIFQNPVSSVWLIANYWDTMIFYPRKDFKITWTNLLPAKGSGHASISIGYFRIVDKHSSEEIKKIVENIQNITGEIIHYYEDYDC